MSKSSDPISSERANVPAGEFVQSNNVQLHLRRWGDWQNESAPIVLLVHGYPDNSLVWTAVASRLARHFRVAAYDVRGAGLSDAPVGLAHYRLSVLSADLSAVIRHLSPNEPVHLVAHDWGSIQSWESVTDPAFRERLLSYTSISGPCLDHIGLLLRSKLKTPGTRQLVDVANQLTSSWYVFLFQLPKLAPLIWKAGVHQRWPAFLQRAEKLAEPPENPHQRKDGLHGMQLYRANVLQRLAAPRPRRTDVPVQLVVPLEDPFVKPAIFTQLADYCSKLTKREIAAGHWLPLSEPEKLAEWITTFALVNNG